MSPWLLDGARWTGRWLLRLAVVLLVAQNLFLNLILPGILNKHPDRLLVRYSMAWMVIPGHVHVSGLSVRGQGTAAQWLVQARRASGRIGLDELMDRRFEADKVRARNVTVRYRRRADVALADGRALDPAAFTAWQAAQPPIPGLSNPATPAPDETPRSRWLVRLNDIQAQSVSDLWIGSYRFTGDAQINAALSIAHPFLDIEGAAWLQGMRVELGGVPVATDVNGEIEVLVDGLDRETPGLDRLASVTATIKADADVQDLEFLDFYLADVPWLLLSGAGRASLNLGLDRGQFRPGSSFVAEFPDLLVKILKNVVSGTGALRVEIDADAAGQPQSHLTVHFQNFAITAGGGASPLVEGLGFHLDATSPEIRPDRPLSDLAVVVDLPQSRIPDLSLYNVFLPTDTGLSLRDGAVSASAHVEVSPVDGHASGTLELSGDDVLVDLDALSISADLALHGVLADADFAAGQYDISGSTLNLSRVGLVNRERPRDEALRRWSATASVPWGVIQPGASIYLDARLRMTAKDSTPFVAMYAEKKKLPAWLQSALSVEDVSGNARLRLGQGSWQIDQCTVQAADKYQIELRYLRDGPRSTGELYASAGALAVGVALRPEGPQLQIVGAKRWFDAQK